MPYVALIDLTNVYSWPFRYRLSSNLFIRYEFFLKNCKSSFKMYYTLTLFSETYKGKHLENEHSFHLDYIILYILYCST